MIDSIEALGRPDGLSVSSRLDTTLLTDAGPVGLVVDWKYIYPRSLSIPQVVLQMPDDSTIILHRNIEILETRIERDPWTEDALEIGFGFGLGALVVGTAFILSR